MAPNRLAMKMSEYVDMVSRAGRPEDGGQPDHTYARSSLWRPQNRLVRPCRYLFSAAGEPPSPDEDPIDVETATEEPAIPVLPHRADATEPGDAAEPDGDGSSWVDGISKAGWSPVQTRVLPKVVHIVDDLRLARLAYEGRPNEQFLVECVLAAGASRLAHLLSGIGWDRNVVHWLHSLLVGNLSATEMDNYLLVLNCVKKKFPALVDRMTAPTGRPAQAKEKPTEQLLKGVAVRNSLADQVAEALLDEKFGKLPHDPVFVVIPGLSESRKSDRFSVMVKQLNQMATVRVVDHPIHPRGATVAHGLDQAATEARATLADVRSKSGGRPVVLVGFGSGAAVACLVSRLDGGRARGVVCLGYPCRTPERDPPGGESAAAASAGCPVLFALGSRSAVSSQDEVEELRAGMRVPTQLVVLAGCDGRFVMGRRDRVLLGLTQAMVDRALLAEVYNFVGELLTREACPPPPTLPSHGEREATASLVGGRGRGPRGAHGRKSRGAGPARQKLILFNSAKYLSLLPHHNYAARYQLQPLAVNNRRGADPK